MDSIAFQLLLQLIRRGDIAQADIDEMAARLEEDGESDAAHAVRAAPFEAHAQTAAESRRAAMRIIDGGNDQV